jgi:hypothetical protein
MIEACVADVSAVQETQAEKKLSASFRKMDRIGSRMGVRLTGR